MTEPISGTRRWPLIALAGLVSVVTDSLAASFTWSQLPALPERRGVAGAFAGITGGGLVVAGGANFPDAMPWQGGQKVWHDRVWLLDRPNGAWREAGKLPRPLAYGVSVTTRDGVLCVGGSDADRHYADGFRLIWNGKVLSCEPLPALPMALSGASGALVGETLYVACGSEQPGEQAATSRAFALELAHTTPAWRELPPLPGRPRLLATAAAHADAFYVLGGAALERQTNGMMSRVYLREAWRYQQEKGWTRVADLPKPIVAAPSPAPVIADRVLVLSGDAGSHAGLKLADRHPGFEKSILAYEPENDRWELLGELPAARVTTPCVAWRGMFVVPSGEVRPGVRSPEVWCVRAKEEER